MGKRSNFDRNPRDYYITPFEATLPLIAFLKEFNLPVSNYIEPCAGNGALVDHLKRHGLVCQYASDIEPQRRDINKFNIFDMTAQMMNGNVIITNPPWDRKLLHSMIEHCMTVLKVEAFLLFDSDWKETKQAVDYIHDYLIAYKSARRQIWIPGTTTKGKDNAGWYYFDPRKNKFPNWYLSFP